jgi:hypothetical protein
MDGAAGQSPSTAGGGKWYGVTIEDPELTSAASFRRLVARASKFVECGAVTMNRLEIVPGIPPAMEGNNDRWPILTVDALDVTLRSLTQFVWGDFFFFSDLEAAQKADQRESFYQMMDSAGLVLTILIKDNTSYAVLTKSLALVCDLLTDDWPVMVIKDELSRHRRWDRRFK